MYLWEWDNNKSLPTGRYAEVTENDLLRFTPVGGFIYLSDYCYDLRYMTIAECGETLVDVEQFLNFRERVNNE